MNHRSYLFVTLDGGGNVPPVLGLVRRLVDRGHEVTVLTEPCLKPAIAASGGRFVPFERHFTRQERGPGLMDDWKARTSAGAFRRTLDRVVFGPARVVAEETERVIRCEQPDVVVADVLMPGALLAAEALGIPRVVVFHMPEYLPGPGRPPAGPGLLPRTDIVGRTRDYLLTRGFHRQLRPFLVPFNAARQALGLPLLESTEEIIEQFHQADLRLIQTCREFDFPITPAPANVRYIGPVLDDPDWAGEWENPWKERDPRPLVVVSVSSTYQNQRRLLQRIISGLGRLEVRGLVTLGPAMAKEKFALPVNVRVVAAAPHSRVFAKAAAVVTHAGHGTIMRALANGLPVLCLPMGRDQYDNTARVLARGAGLRLSPSARPRRIASSVRQLIDDPEFALNARRMRRIIRRDVSSGRGVAELEAVGLTPVGRGV